MLMVPLHVNFTNELGGVATKNAHGEFSSHYHKYNNTSTEYHVLYDLPYSLDAHPSTYLLNSACLALVIPLHTQTDLCDACVFW